MVKDFLVHLDATRWDDVRLAWAERIGSVFDAHVGGLFINIIPEVIMTAVGGGSEQLVAEMVDDARTAGQAAALVLQGKLDRLRRPNELLHLDLLRSSLRTDLPAVARTADLLLGIKPYGAADLVDFAPDVVEAALFGTGRGVFVVPHAAPTEMGDFAHVAIGWENSRESVRAVAEAMPFLHKAERITVIIANEDGHPERHGQTPGSDIATHLAHHGLGADVVVVRGRGNDIARALLDECETVKADLLVMGAYSRSRLSEWILGGVTRDVLHQATLPVLFAH